MEQMMTSESWHGECFIKVGLWLQPGRKNFRGLGGGTRKTPTGLLFFLHFLTHRDESDKRDAHSLESQLLESYPNFFPVF